MSKKKDRYEFIPPEVSPSGRIGTFMPPLQRIKRAREDERIRQREKQERARVRALMQTMGAVTAREMDAASKPSRVRRRGPRRSYGRPG